MAYEYSPTWSDHPYTYNENDYTIDPKYVLNFLPEDHEDYGTTIQSQLGMTDAECDAVITPEKWRQVRAYRDKLLVESDWTQGDDVPSSIKTPYATYRQALRDITTGTDPDNLTWPTKP